MAFSIYLYDESVRADGVYWRRTLTEENPRFIRGLLLLELPVYYRPSSERSYKNTVRVTLLSHREIPQCAGVGPRDKSVYNLWMGVRRRRRRKKKDRKTGKELRTHACLSIEGEGLPDADGAWKHYLNCQ